MENGVCAAVRGVGMINLKLTSEKTMLLKNVQHIPLIRKNLISGPLLCRDGYKLVFESIHLLEKATRAEACSAGL
jgi:hypothetical protein